MKRRINLRAPVAAAAALASGIALSYAAVFYGADARLFSAALLPCVTIYFYLRFALKRRKAAEFFAIAAVFCALGFVLGLQKFISFEINEAAEGGIYRVSGIIEKTGETDYGKYLVLKNVTLDGKRISGKLYLSLGDDLSSFYEGWRVNFDGSLIKYAAFEYGKLSYVAPQGIKYYCEATGEVGTEYAFSVFGALRRRIRETLYSNLDGDTASVLLAMLTGDSQGVEAGTLTALRYGGVAHIFAVSGLHIGIVYGAINGICRLCRAGKRTSSFVALGFAFFYSGLCGWTLSSVRASVMCAVGAVASASRRKYDGLNSLALSVIIILVLQPLSLFTVGFLLSVCAVAGINLFSKGVERTLKFLPRGLRSAVAVTLSSTAGTAPVMLCSFGYLSTVGLLLNVVFIPVISSIFTVVFAATAISAALPQAGILLRFAALPFEAVTSFLVKFGLEGALISGFGAGLFPALYFVAVVFLSDKLNYDFVLRLGACALAAACAAFYVAFRLNAGWGVTVTAAGKDGEICVIIKSPRGSVIIISDGADPDFVTEQAFEAYCPSPNAVVILGDSPVGALGPFGLNCKTVYIFEENPHVFLPNGMNYVYAGEFSECGIDFSFVGCDGLSAEVGGAEICVSAGDFIPFYECDLLVASSENLYCSSRFVYYAFPAESEFSAYYCGTLVFRGGDGGLYLLSSPRK